uniref:Uncharacterized protein n=1 Tax=Magallana gigas TaxID=29159 RepID=A0A8W8JJE3_MAGGI|nr:uncharacterized protein LOC117692315 [Crassostrea gigas]
MDDSNYDLENIPLVMDIRPYMFEPPAECVNQENSSQSSEESESDTEDNPGHRRNGTIWCECGSCEVMPTEAECICCSEIPAIDHIRDSFGIECITQHQTVIDNCLNIRVLESLQICCIQEVCLMGLAATRQG